MRCQLAPGCARVRKMVKIFVVNGNHVLNVCLCEKIESVNDHAKEYGTNSQPSMSM